MNERFELDALKQRQRNLAAQLAGLREDIQRLEERLNSQPEIMPKLAAVEPTAIAVAPELTTPATNMTSTSIPRTRVPPPIPVVPETVVLQVQTPIEVPTVNAKPVEAPPVIVSEEQSFQTSEPAAIAESASITEGPDSGPAGPNRVAAVQRSFEMRLGTYWFVRIGVVMLLTALGFFATFAYQNYLAKLGAAGKVGMLYTLSAGLLGAGAWLQRKREKEALKNFGQVLIAGGLAAAYFTTYAAHYFKPLQVIVSPMLAGSLLFGWACFIVWLAERKKSEVLGFFAVALAYYTSAISKIALFTLYSNLLLTVAAAFFLVRNRWAGVSFLSLVATYASYGYWRLYHDGQFLWRWNLTPGDFWTGNLFLLGYWIIFTTAVFLSKHEKLSGWNRAAFLSLNNGALFVFVTLTLPLVYPGAFWKFALGYGVVLTILCLLAQRALPEEQVAHNSYLAQGVVLVTLGFITYFSRPTLGLVLAAESVVLLVLNSHRKNSVLSTGAYLIGALAVAMQVWETQKSDPRGLYSGAAVGAFMFFNAIWRNERATQATRIEFKPTWFSLLALVSWFVATWQNASPQNLGLVLATEAAMITVAFHWLRLREASWTSPCYLPFEAGAYVFSAVAVAIQILATHEFDPRGLYSGAAVGALMVFNAFSRNQRASDPRRVVVMSAYFSLLALVMWLVTTWQNTERANLPPILAVETLLITASIYLLRLRELAFMAQGYLILAQLLVLWHWAQKGSAPPWWNPAIVIAATVSLSHWWQRQKTVPLEKPISRLIEGVYALAAVGVVFYWLEPIFAMPGSRVAWLCLTSVLSAGIAIYGAVTRAWCLCAAGQIFLAISVWEFFRQTLFRLPPGPIALVPIATLILTALVGTAWMQRRTQPNSQTTRVIHAASICYRAVALVMSLLWVHKYIPEEFRFMVLALLGGFVFLMHGWKPAPERLVFSAAFTLTGLANFWLIASHANGVTWQNVLAILLLLAQQQFARRVPERYEFHSTWHTILILVGGCSAWLLDSRWVLLTYSGFYLTTNWAVFALLIFGVGLVLKEREYRWLGLTVLGCAMSRVVIFDVWKLETIYRVLSFLALGVVLVVLGFIYNKYQEKIRSWL